MQSNNKLGLGITMLLAGCAGGSGYEDAPRIASPSAQAIEQPYGQQEYPPAEPVAQAGQAPGYQLQGDYPPEPGAQSYDVAVPPSSAQPGASYARPGTRQAPAVRQPAYREPLPADAPPAVVAGTGPRGTSGETQRYDAVGYASWYGEEMGEARTADGQSFDASAITVAHRTVPLGSIVEITVLDTGRTILALVNDRGPGGRDREVDLSRGSAQALGLTSPLTPVRVRLVTASPQDIGALKAGRPASQRIDAPPALLTALRRKLPARPAGMARPARPVADHDAPWAPRPTPQRGPRVTSGIFVQVAALSSEGRAQALASSLGGRIERAGSIYRVQIGPYANTASAQRARDDVARRGYGDARIVTTN